MTDTGTGSLVGSRILTAARHKKIYECRITVVGSKVSSCLQSLSIPVPGTVPYRYVLSVSVSPHPISCEYVIISIRCCVSCSIYFDFLNFWGSGSLLFWFVTLPFAVRYRHVHYRYFKYPSTLLSGRKLPTRMPGTRSIMPAHSPALRPPLNYFDSPPGASKVRRKSWVDSYENWFF